MTIELAFDLNQDRDFLFSGGYAERIIIDRQRNFAYCPIPKCANTTIKVALKPEEYNMKTDASAMHAKGLFETLTSLSPDQRAAFMATAFKFIVVRNPFSRLLSAFLDKFETRGLGNGKWQNEHWKSFAIFMQGKLRERGMQTDNMGLSFREFIYFVCGTPHEMMNEHWHPQTLLGMFEQIPYDVVIKYEQLGEGFNQVADRLGIGRLPKPDEIHFTPTHSDLHLAEYFNDELEQIVKEKFREDFFRLSYPTNIERLI